MKVCEKCGAAYGDWWVNRCINTAIVNGKLDTCGGKVK